MTPCPQSVRLTSPPSAAGLRFSSDAPLSVGSWVHVQWRQLCVIELLAVRRRVADNLIGALNTQKNKSRR